MIEPRLCIYHGNCADGFGAAWAALKNNIAHTTALDKLMKDLDDDR